MKVNKHLMKDRENDLKKYLEDTDTTKSFNGRGLNIDNIVDIEVEGIDYSDAPDFCDAFISSANWTTGESLTDEELEILNRDYSEFVYEQVINTIY